MNLYEQLGVAVDAEEEVIRKAIAGHSVIWSRRITQATSTRARTEAERMLEVLSTARQQLLDANRRISYDATLSSHVALPMTSVEAEYPEDEPARAPCRICGELIPTAALKCRFCNEWLGGKRLGRRRLGEAALLLAVLACGLFFVTMKPAGPDVPKSARPPAITVPSMVAHARPSAVPTPPRTRLFKPAVPPATSRTEALRRQGMTYYNHGYTLFLQTGNLEARDNLYRQALSKFRQASALAPHDPQPIFNEAVVLVEMDQRDKSYNLLKRVISMAAPDAKPLKREAQRIMARIEARGKAR